jgi:hypothetical protein
VSKEGGERANALNTDATTFNKELRMMSEFQFTAIATDQRTGISSSAIGIVKII